MKFARGRPLRDLTVANTPEGPACADAQGRVCRLRRQTSCANPKVKARTGSGQSPIPLLLLRPKGLEPPTPGSEDRCSIQLSYGRMATLRVACEFEQSSNVVFDADCEQIRHPPDVCRRQTPTNAQRSRWEERRDSNPRPPGPQPGALTDCATLPMYVSVFYARWGGLRNGTLVSWPFGPGCLRLSDPNLTGSGFQYAPG